MQQQLTYDDIVLRINNGEYRHSRKVKDLIRHKECVERFLPIIQENRKSSMDIRTESLKERYVIYQLCNILDIRWERIEERVVRRLECCDFHGRETDPYTGCGCGNIPARFEKYEMGLDYDGLYMQYEIPWVYKRGVRIFYDNV